MPPATTLDRDQTIARLASHLRGLTAAELERHFPSLPAAVELHLPGESVATAPAVPLLKLAHLTMTKAVTV